MADNYGQWFITKMFTDAEAAAVTSGKQITFKKMIASQDIFTQDDLATLTNSVLGTIDIKQQVNISTVLPSTGSYKVQGVFSNSTVTADYLMNTILLVGSYNGAEFLAAAQVANNAFKMPAASTGEQTIYTIAAQISVSNTATVSLTVDPDSIVTNAGLKVVTDAQAVKDSAQDVKISSLETKDAQNVKITGNQTVGGVKTYTEKIVGSISGTADTALAFLRTAILSESDLNDFITSGSYYIEGTSPKNYPQGANGYGFLDVVSGTDSLAVVQELSTVEGKKYFRNYFNSGWTPWNYIYSGANDVTAIYKKKISVNMVWGAVDVYLSRTGNVVTCQFDRTATTRATWSSNDYLQVGTIPYGFGPANGIGTATMQGSLSASLEGYHPLNAWVGHDKILTVQNKAKTTTESVRLFLSGTWITDESWPSS